MAIGAGEHALVGAVAADDSISIEVLGAVRLVHLGGTADLPAGARTVLALLAFHAGADRRDGELIDAIWPGEPPRDPRRELRRQMRPLRQHLGEIGARTGLRPNTVTVIRARARTRLRQRAHPDRAAC